MGKRVQEMQRRYYDIDDNTSTYILTFYIGNIEILKQKIKEIKLPTKLILG